MKNKLPQFISYLTHINPVQYPNTSQVKGGDEREVLFGDIILLFFI